MTTPPPTPERTLDVFEVMEEEYAHLHPKTAPLEGDPHFTADQVRDPLPLARIFCEAEDKSGRRWDQSPAHAVALVVLDAQAELREAARTVHEAVVTDPAPARRFVDLLIARLNVLIDGPLLGDPALLALYPDAGISTADAHEPGVPARIHGRSVLHRIAVRELSRVGVVHHGSDV